MASIVCVTLGLVLTGIAFGHFDTFYSGDSVVKLLAAQSLTHHWTDSSIPYVFGRIDPHGTYVLPLTAWMNGHDYSGYSLPFEYMTAISITILEPPAQSYRQS